jgi:hypothetical protein
MSVQDAKRYQYLKKHIESGDVRVNGGYLTRQNIGEWDDIIDDHLKRLEVKSEFKKGQLVNVCTLNPKQPIWLKKYHSYLGEVLESWKDKSTDRIIYKIKYSHNGAIGEYKDYEVLAENVFDEYEQPSWIKSASVVMSKIRLVVNSTICVEKLLNEIKEIARTEKIDNWGCVEVEVHCPEPYVTFLVSLNKKITYFRTHGRTNKNALINELKKALNQT